MIAATIALAFLSFASMAQAQDVFANDSSAAGCGDAKNREYELWERNRADIAQREVENSNTYKQDRLRCGPGDRQCLAAASEKHRLALRDTKGAYSAETARHQKTLIKLRVEVCAVAPPAKPSGTPARPVGSGTSSVGTRRPVYRAPRNPAGQPGSPNSGPGNAGGGEPAANLPYPGHPGASTPAPAGVGGTSNLSAIDRNDYWRGFSDGVGDCISGLADMLAGFGLFMQGDFEGAAKAWGLEPGQSIFLKTLYAELTTPRIGPGVSPYEAGRIVGRRLCAYGVAPAAPRVAGTIAGAAVPGLSPLNPLRGRTITSGVTHAPKAMANMWIETPKGPVQLGGHIRNGSYGAVYRSAAEPKQMIKVSLEKAESAPSFPRQKTGTLLLEEAGIPAPTIYQWFEGSASKPALLFMDDIAAKFPGAKTLSELDLQNMSPAELTRHANAAHTLWTDVGKAGLVWVDGHFGNMAFIDRGGILKAVVVDADMFMRESQVAAEINARSVPGQKLLKMLIDGGRIDLLGGPMKAPTLMEALWQAHVQGRVQ